MMKQPIKLRFIVAWGAYNKGDEITPMSRMYADQLTEELKVCERVDVPPSSARAPTKRKKVSRGA